MLWCFHLLKLLLLLLLPGVHRVWFWPSQLCWCRILWLDHAHFFVVFSTVVSLLHLTHVWGYWWVGLCLREYLLVILLWVLLHVLSSESFHLAQLVVRSGIRIWTCLLIIETSSAGTDLKLFIWKSFFQRPISGNDICDFRVGSLYADGVYFKPLAFHGQYFIQVYH